MVSPIYLKMVRAGISRFLDADQTDLDLHFTYSLSGLCLGMFCIALGFVLCLRGVSGRSVWAAKFVGFESRLKNAAPGVILFLVGLAIVYVTRYRV